MKPWNIDLIDGPDGTRVANPQYLQRVAKQVRRAEMTPHERKARRSLLRVAMGYYGIVNPYVDTQALAVRVIRNGVEVAQ